MRVKLNILIVCVAITFGCTNRFKKSATPMFLELEKTSCMGPCPVFTLTLFEKEAKFIGIENTKYIGEYSAVLSDDLSAAVVNYIKNDDVWSSANEYMNNEMLDLPTTMLRISNGQETKQIKIYGERPEHLMPLIEFLNAQRSGLIWNEVN